MKYLLIFLIITISSNSFSNDIFKHIIKNKPTINKDYAEKLSFIIIKESKENNIDPKIISAIFMQESSYKLSVINKKSQDYSIGQINIKNIDYYNLDKERLLIDLSYSVKSTLLILKNLKIKYAKKEKKYWSRYHSFKPSYRKKYEKLIEKYE